MSQPPTKRIKLQPPTLLESNSQELCLDSTLASLSLHKFQVEAEHLCLEVAQVLERYPLLPGAVISDRQSFIGIVSRQRLMEFILREQTANLPISALHSYIRINSLVLPVSTSILVAAQLALQRSLYEQSEPITVQLDPQTYCLLDVHELNIAHWQIRGIETQTRYERAQLQMIQTERMANLGRLVDGVAHEILDPVGFIWGNLVHLSDYTQQIMELLAAYEDYLPQAPEAIAIIETEIELDYVRQDLPQTIASITSGAERLKKLVISLQNFCHIDDVYPKPADIHECLDSILLLLKSRLNSEIQVICNYGHLPPVSCYAGQLSQVFMNILTNAMDALLNQAVRQTVANELGKLSPTHWQNLDPKPQISITTQVRPQSANPDQPDSNTRWISIRIADNGPGLTPEIYQQILETFSIEKRVSKETSLSLSYQIVTAKHGGKLLMRSPAPSSNTGTEFEILLPLA
jgi:signal transduction histidine kinase